MNLSEGKSLQLLCVICITKNLNRFNFAYLSTKDEQLKMLLLFLQKSYASQLLQITTDNYSNVLEREYFQLLIHEHLKELNTKIFKEGDLHMAMERVCEIAPMLQEITFQFGKDKKSFRNSKSPRSFIQEVIPHLKAIEILKLHSSYHCNDETLKLLSCYCPTLKELSIHESYVTSKGLKQLCPNGKSKGLTLKSFELCPNEESFSFESSELEDTYEDLDKGISYLLQAMPSLEEIEYRQFYKILIQLHQKELYNNTLHLLPRYNITTLDMFSDLVTKEEQIEDILLIASEVFPRLTRLSVPVMNSNILETLEKFINLSYLKIIRTSNFFVSSSLREERKCLNVNNLLMRLGKKLIYLDMWDLEFSISVLILNCSALEALSFCCRHLEAPVEGNESYLNKLKLLSISGYDNKVISMEKSLDILLKSCSKLEGLSFVSSHFNTNDRHFDILQNFCVKTESLKELEIRHSDIQISLLKAITLCCKPLKKLKVDFCHNIELEEMKELKNLLEAECVFNGRIKKPLNEINLELNLLPDESDDDSDDDSNNDSNNDSNDD